MVEVACVGNPARALSEICKDLQTFTSSVAPFENEEGRETDACPSWSRYHHYDRLLWRV